MILTCRGARRGTGRSSLVQSYAALLLATVLARSPIFWRSSVESVLQLNFALEVIFPADLAVRVAQSQGVPGLLQAR